MNTLPSRPPPKPWPMKWVVAAILVFIVAYTFVNLFYRKPGKPHEPSAEMNSRATVARLLAAGWQRVPVALRRPAEKPAVETAAGIGRGGPGLGLELDDIFAERPRLLASIDRVIAPALVARGAEYAIYYTASLADQRYELADVTLYRKGSVLVLISSTEPLPGHDLLSRWKDSIYWVGFPTQSLPPGRYRVRLVAHGPAAMWSFDVR